MKTAQCKSCGGSFEYDPEFVICGVVPPLCEPCNAADLKLRLAKRKREYQRHRWLEICPEMFRDTMIEQLPRREKSEEALAYKLNGKGLNMFGRPGTGKTRTMYLILERLHFDGIRIALLTPNEFNSKCEMKNFCRAPWLAQLKHVGVLAFDDFDKMTLTKDMEADLFSVLDVRMTKHRPMIFTGNCDGDQLKLRFRNGEAIVRRIRTACYSIYFP